MVRPVWLERYSSRTRDPYVLLWGLPAMWDRHLGSNPAHVVALFVTTVVAGVPGVAGAPRPTCHAVWDLCAFSVWRPTTGSSAGAS